MNNILKRTIAFVLAIGILINFHPFPCGESVTKNTTDVITTSVCEKQTVLEKLDCLENGELSTTELDSLCNEILKEVALVSTISDVPTYVKESTELTARQNVYEDELKKRAAKVNILTEKVRSGEAEEQDISELREMLYPDSVMYQSDATPSEIIPNTAPNMIEGTLSSNSLTFLSDVPSADDLILKDETFISQSLIDKAKELGSANAIYLFIRNNIQYEIYGNSKKGASVTFEQQGGNDIDQASLLIAMLRSIDIPSRYVYGKIEITAEQAMDITGTKEIESAGRILAASFDNVTGLISESIVTGYRMEHTWVEAYVPYTNYRGAGKNSGDSIWLPLDVSFKKLETTTQFVNMEYTNEDRKKHDELSKLAEDNLIYNPIEPMKDQEELVFQSIIQTDDQYLPNTLPYQVIEVNDRCSTIPNGKRSTLQIAVGGETLLNSPLSELYAQRIILSYEPASAIDRELMSENNDLTTIPAYLVHVVPVLTVGENIYRGNNELSLGMAQKMLMTVSGDSGDSILTDVVWTGSVYAVTLDYEKIGYADSLIAESRLKKEEKASKDGSVDNRELLGTFLENIGKQYFSYCDFRSLTCESLFHVRKNRELGIVITGYEYETDRTLGVCNSLKNGRFMMDVAFNRFRTVSLENDSDAEIQFNMTLAAIESYYEGAVWENYTNDQLSGISTVSVMGIAEELDIPIVIICEPNVEETLETCSVSSQVKKEVRDYVNRGLVVRLISKTLNIGDWTGTAYVTYDMETGACSYMLSNGTAGGSTRKLTIEEMLDLNMMLFQMTLALSECDYALSVTVFENEQGKMFMGPVAEMVVSPAMSSAASAVFESEKQIGTAMNIYYDTLSFVLDYAFEGEAVYERLANFTKENLDKLHSMLKNKVLDTILNIVGIRDLCVDDSKAVGPLVDAMTDTCNSIYNILNNDMDIISANGYLEKWDQAAKNILDLINH